MNCNIYEHSSQYDAEAAPYRRAVPLAEIIKDSDDRAKIADELRRSGRAWVGVGNHDRTGE